MERLCGVEPRGLEREIDSLPAMEPDRPLARGWIRSVVLASVVLSAGRATGIEEGAESYYMVVFAAQDEGHHPETSHCFATFARVVPRPGREPRVELHHINWFSERGHRTGATHGIFEDDGRPALPEPGENRTTREALLMAYRGGQRISRWGPYEIERGLHERALRHIEILEGRVPGRRVLYKALDIGCREGSTVVALNCVHAVSDIDRECGPLRTWTSYGDQAARTVVGHLGRWIRGPERDHPEVWEQLWRLTWGSDPSTGPRIAQGASLSRRDIRFMQRLPAGPGSAEPKAAQGLE
jgi:hypothetical protein